MTQKRYWNPNDPFLATKAREVHIGLNTAGVYRRYGVTVAAPDTIEIGAGGFALLPDGICVTEDHALRLRITVLPALATEYTITARHTETNQTAGAAVVYAIETGHLTNADVSNGIVLAWIHYPGGGVQLQQSYIELVPLVGEGNVPGGVAGGDLSGTYPDPTVAGIQNVPVAAGAVDGDILVVTSGQYTPTQLSSLVGTGIPSANFNALGASTSYSVPTNFVDGFRNFGVPITIARVVLSQEVAGSSGVTEVRLFRVSQTGVETQITPNNSLLLPYTAGNKAMVISTSFIPGAAVFDPNDRLGMKVISLQVGGEDVSVDVIVSGATVPVAPIVSADTHVTQSMNESVFGNVFSFVGSIWLPACTLLASDSRIAFGAALLADSANLELRRMSDGGVVYSTTVTGGVASIPLPGNINIASAGFYEWWLRSPSGGTGLLNGVHLVWSPVTSMNLNFSANVTLLGTTPFVAGCVYMSAGTLQTGAVAVLDAYGPGTPTAYLDVIRPDLNTVVGTFQTSGVAGRQEAATTAPISLPISGFYTLHLRGNAATTTTGFHALRASIVV
jgi:hypothetical protein